MRCLIIIPAYNEGGALKDVIDELNQSISGCEDTYEYVVINDGSTDNTRKLCKDNNINCISLPINLGIGGAVQTGYLYARKYEYDVAIQMDGDGQHLPKYLPSLIAPIKDGQADCVIGSRFCEGSEKDGFKSSLFRRMGIHFLCFIIKLACGERVTDSTSGFRAVNKEGIRLFAKYYSKDFPEPEAIVLQKKYGLRTKEIPVVMRERLSGQSSISLFSSMYYMIKVTLAVIIAGFEKKKDINEVEEI